MSSSAPTGESISCQYVGGVTALALTIAPPVGEVCGRQALLNFLAGITRHAAGEGGAADDPLHVGIDQR